MTTSATVAGVGEARLGIWFLLVALSWTILIVVVAYWDYQQSYSSSWEAAKAGARNSYDKDLAHRRWASLHGGVYVPISAETPPSPYLAHIPERDIATPSGKKLTLMNPAYMARQVHEMGGKQYGLRGHITSLKPMTVYTCTFSVMPDLIRHPEGFEKTGFRLSPERRLSLNQAIHGQTLILQRMFLGDKSDGRM